MGISECNQEGTRLEAISIELQKKSPKESIDAAWTASYYFLLGDSCEKTNQMFKRVLMLMPHAKKGITAHQARIFMYLEQLDGTNLRQFKTFSIGAQEKLLSAKMSAKKEADALPFLASLGLTETAARCIFCYVLPHAHDFLKAIDLSQDKKHRCKLCAKDK
jgi:hypothetical protein